MYFLQALAWFGAFMEVTEALIQRHLIYQVSTGHDDIAAPVVTSPGLHLDFGPPPKCSIPTIDMYFFNFPCG